MNLVDLILILLLGLGTYLGYKRGLFISLVRLCALFVGLVAGAFLWSHVREWLSLLDIQTPPLPPILLFIFVFFLALFLFMLLAKGLKRTIYLTPFRFLDKGAGALFGMTSWMLMLGLLLWMTNTLQYTPLHTQLRHSTIAPTLRHSAEAILVWIIPPQHIEKIT